MLRPRRESLHSDGITDQKSLQRTSATKSANKRHRGAPAANQRRPSFPDCSDQDSFQSGL